MDYGYAGQHCARWLLRYSARPRLVFGAQAQSLILLVEITKFIIRADAQLPNFVNLAFFIVYYLKIRKFP